MGQYERYSIESCRLIKGTQRYVSGIYDNLTETFLEEYSKKGFTMQFLHDEVKRLNWDFNDYDETISQYCETKTYKKVRQFFFENIIKISIDSYNKYSSNPS